MNELEIGHYLHCGLRLLIKPTESLIKPTESLFAMVTLELNSTGSI